MRTQALFVLAILLDRGAYAVFLALVTWGLGLSGDSDLLFIVISVPATLSMILSEVCFVVIPRAIGDVDGEAAKWHETARTLTVFAAAFCLTGLAVAVLAEPLMAVIAPGLPPERHAQAVSLQRLAAALLPAQGGAAILASLLMAFGRVLSGSMRQPLISAVTAIGAGAWCAAWQPEVTGFLASAIAAPLVAMALLGWRVARLPRPVPLSRLRWLPRPGHGALLSGVALNSTTYVIQNLIVLAERAIASTIAPGAVSILAVARAMGALTAAVPGAMANAAYLGSVSRPGAVAVHCRHILMSAMVAGLPIGVVFFTELRALVAFFFERGRFGPEQTGDVTLLALCFGAGYLNAMLGGALQRVCQMLKMDVSLFLIGAASPLPYALFVLVLGGWEHLPQLALAYSAMATCFVAATAVAIARRAGWEALRLPYGRLAAATAVSTLAALATERWLLPAGAYPLARLAACTSVVGATFLAAGWCFRLPDIRRPEAPPCAG